MKKILTNLALLLLLFLTCKSNKESKIENYRLSELDNNWALNSIGYYIDVEHFIDFDNNGIGDLKGIINNIDYFNKDNLNVDFIILGNILDEKNCFNTKIGSEKELIDLIKIADPKGIKIVFECNIDFEKEDNYNFIEKYILMGFAGFRANCKNIDNLKGNLNHFIHFVKDLKKEYSYLLVFCNVDKDVINFDIDIENIAFFIDDISSIDFSNSSFKFINFQLKESKYLNILPKLIFMLPQIPIIKYGYEFGILKPENFIMQKNIATINSNTMFETYKDVIRLRKDLKINPQVKFVFHSNDKNIVSFFLITENKKYFIVINKNPYLSLCYLKEGEWQKEIHFKNEIVLKEIYGDSVNTKYYIPEKRLDVFANIKDSSLKIFEIIESSL